MFEACFTLYAADFLNAWLTYLGLSRYQSWTNLTSQHQNIANYLAYLAVVDGGYVVNGTLSGGGGTVAIFVDESPNDGRVDLRWQHSPRPRTVRRASGELVQWTEKRFHVPRKRQFDREDWRWAE